QSAPALVPQGDREHAVEVADEVEPVVLVEVNDDLGVGPGIKAVAPRLQLPAQLGEIVDLAVEDRPDVAILAVDRLLPGVDVDDREPTHCEAGVALEIVPCVVGTPVDEGLAHRAKRLGLHGTIRLRIELTDDAAHCELSVAFLPRAVAWHG